MIAWKSDAEVARQNLIRWLDAHLSLTDEEDDELWELIFDYGDAERQAGADGARD